jgi:N6-L-threonylcarbamoyladenine synthase
MKEAHALTARLEGNVQFPYLCLLISGGHTLLVIVHSVGHHEILDSCLDDSIGEVYDKAASILSIDWLPEFGPGAAVEKIALEGREDFILFTEPLSKKGIKNNFSFSGLKSALSRAAEEHLRPELSYPNQKRIKADLAASFQKTACGHLLTRLRQAFDKKNVAGCQNLVVSGGVARNRYIRHK